MFYYLFVCTSVADDEKITKEREIRYHIEFLHFIKNKQKNHIFDFVLSTNFVINKTNTNSHFFLFLFLQI